LLLVVEEVFWNPEVVVEEVLETAMVLLLAVRC
jgi:hypothetical protein